MQFACVYDRILVHVLDIVAIVGKSAPIDLLHRFNGKWLDLVIEEVPMTLGRDSFGELVRPAFETKHPLEVEGRVLLDIDSLRLFRRPGLPPLLDMVLEFIGDRIHLLKQVFLIDMLGPHRLQGFK